MTRTRLTPRRRYLLALGAKDAANRCGWCRVALNADMPTVTRFETGVRYCAEGCRADAIADEERRAHAR